MNSWEKTRHVGAHRGVQAAAALPAKTIIGEERTNG
jgi:hypothetical protein